LFEGAGFGGGGLVVWFFLVGAPAGGYLSRSANHLLY